MIYHVRPGVVRTTICEVNMLLATRQAENVGGSVRFLNLLEAVAVEILEKQEPISQMQEVLMILTKCTQEEAKDRSNAIYSTLAKEGWILAEDVQ